MKRFVVGISGASGMPLAVTLLRGLRDAARALPGGAQVHLVVSDAARQVLALESDLRAEDLLALADVVPPSPTAPAATCCTAPPTSP